MNKFIGQKKIKDTKIESNLVRVEYEDGLKEVFSKLMYDAIVSEEACDLTKLRDKRVQPIVKAVLGVLKDWGIKLGEIQYMSTLLNQSLQFSEDEATRELWSKYLPNIKSMDDVDMLSLDKVLRTKKPEEPKPILSPFNEPDKTTPSE